MKDQVKTTEVIEVVPIGESTDDEEPESKPKKAVVKEKPGESASRKVPKKVSFLYVMQDLVSISPTIREAAKYDTEATKRDREDEKCDVGGARHDGENNRSKHKAKPFLFSSNASFLCG